MDFDDASRSESPSSDLQFSPVSDITLNPKESHANVAGNFQSRTSITDADEKYTPMQLQKSPKHRSISPETPEQQTLRSQLPSLTSVADRVRDVSIPDKFKQRYESQNFRPPSVVAGRMPLKDQNDSYNKMQKENFDLKLKLHFLMEKTANPDFSIPTDINKYLQQLIAMNKNKKRLESEANGLRAEMRRLKEESVTEEELERRLEATRKEVHMEYELSNSKESQDQRNDREKLVDSNAKQELELSAQSEMLTRLQKEKAFLTSDLENLRLQVNRLERTSDSASRQSQRASEDNEAENGRLKDQIVKMKLNHRDVYEQLQIALSDLEKFERAVAEFEDVISLLRDEKGGIEIMLENLRIEAETKIEKLEDLLDNRTDAYLTLKEEIDTISSHGWALEDSAERAIKDYEGLVEELDDLRSYVAQLEAQQDSYKVRGEEGLDREERLGAQIASLNQEIAFSREEAESGVFRTAQLENQLKSLQQKLVAEQGQRTELEKLLHDERLLRDESRNLKQNGWEKWLDERNVAVEEAKEEVRKFKKEISQKEMLYTGLKSELDAIEQNLRSALQDNESPREQLILNLPHLKRNLDAKVEELQSLRVAITEKDILLRDRENLLEVQTLQTKKLTSLLDKERHLRRVQSTQPEGKATSKLSPQKQGGWASRSSARATTPSDDKVSDANSDARLRDQVRERDTFLEQLRSKLDVVSGISREGAQVEISIEKAFPEVKQAALQSLGAVEKNILSFRSSVTTLEQELRQDYKVMEKTLESKIRRLERMEHFVKSKVNDGFSFNEVSNSQSAPTSLKPEVKPSQESQMLSSVAQKHPISSYSTTTVDTTFNTKTAGQMSSSDVEFDHKWDLRLKELEKRLKNEQEGRLRDRQGAKQRLDTVKKETEILKNELRQPKR